MYGISPVETTDLKGSKEYVTLTFFSSATAHHIHIKQYYTLDARSIRVLRESSLPEPTTYKAYPLDPSNNAETLAISVEDEFDNFTSKKRRESRTEITPEPTDARSCTTSKPAPTCASNTSEKKQKKKQRISELEKPKVTEVDKPLVSDIEIDINI